MGWVSNKTLVKIAAYGGIFVVSAAMLMRDTIVQRIKREEYYKEALRLVRTHPGAVTLLGEPIKEYGFKLEDKSNFCDGKNAYFQVKLKGPKDSGQMFFWAQRDESKWNVSRVELEIKSQEDKRLLVKKDS